MRIITLCASLIAASLLAVSPADARGSGFYRVAAADIAGEPGTVIRAQSFKAPPGASGAYRVIYRSTDPGGRPIAVSGVVIVPSGQAPLSGRPIVSWGHATSGIAPGCARSMYGGLYTGIYGLQDMLARGFVVAATDYPGLGVPGGVHPYLIGDSQARAVLDMARAARALRQAHAGNTVIPAGYSQGGHAALFAAARTASYAPDLDLAGVAASAPPTDLSEMIRASGADPIGRVFATFALVSWSKLYGLPLDGVLAAPVGKVARNIASECNLKLGQSVKMLFAEQAFEREGFLDADLARLPKWNALMTRNSAPPTPAGLPVFIAQGRSDHLVRPEVTQSYARRLCARGTPLTMIEVNGRHDTTPALAAASMVNWIAERFARQAPQSDCGRMAGASNR